MSLGLKGILELDLTQGSFLCMKWNVLSDVFLVEKKTSCEMVSVYCFCVGKGEK